MNKSIEQELKKHDEYQKRLMALDDAVNSVESVLSSRTHMQGSLSVSIGYGVHLGISVFVDSLKEVPSLVRSLSRHGIRVDPDRKFTSDSTGHTYRLLVETPYAVGHREQVTLTVYVREAVNAKCVYTKVGEKTIDIMEWKCE